MGVDVDLVGDDSEDCGEDDEEDDREEVDQASHCEIVRYTEEVVVVTD